MFPSWGVVGDALLGVEARSCWWSVLWLPIYPSVITSSQRVARDALRGVVARSCWRFLLYVPPSFVNTSYARVLSFFFTVAFFHSFLGLSMGYTRTVSPIDRGLRLLRCMYCSAVTAFFFSIRSRSPVCILGLRQALVVGIRVFVRRPINRCAGLVVMPSWGVLCIFSRPR